jgi:hypothetical protein
LPDKWEGFPPNSYSSKVLDIFEGTALPSTVGLEFFNSVNSRAVVSCWHENENESIAMWKLYTSGNDGVAISSTVGRLKGALRDFSDDFLIGRVRYIDHLKADDDDISAYTPVFRKRLSYEHEREVRAVISIIQSNRPLTDALEAIKSTPPEKVQAVPARADLATLIETVVLSPEYPPWDRDGIQQIVRSAGLEIRIENSDCSAQPERRDYP